MADNKIVIATPKLQWKLRELAWGKTDLIPDQNALLKMGLQPGIPVQESFSYKGYFKLEIRPVPGSYISGGSEDAEYTALICYDGSDITKTDAGIIHYGTSSISVPRTAFVSFLPETAGTRYIVVSLATSNNAASISLSDTLPVSTSNELKSILGKIVYDGEKTTLVQEQFGPVVFGSVSADNTHPFDVELVTGGTEEEPTYSVKVYNSALPNSPYAGIVYIGTATYSVPVDELNIEVEEGDEFFVDLVVTYDAETDPVYTLEFEARTDIDIEDDDNVFRQTIAEGILPEISSMQNGNIRITDRWV